MEGTTPDAALARINAALARIEAAAARTHASGADLAARHDRLKSAVAESLQAIDGLIAARSR